MKLPKIWWIPAPVQIITGTASNRLRLLKSIRAQKIKGSLRRRIIYPLQMSRATQLGEYAYETSEAFFWITLRNRLRNTHVDTVSKSTYGGVQQNCGVRRSSRIHAEVGTMKLWNQMRIVKTLDPINVELVDKQTDVVKDETSIRLDLSSARTENKTTWIMSRL